MNPTVYERLKKEDERIIILGEDVEMLRVNLFSRFGPKRVVNTPISEAAIIGTGVGAAMAPGNQKCVGI